MFLNDSARVKILLLVLMSEIKNQSYSGKKKFLFFFFVFFSTHLVGHLHSLYFVYLYAYLFPILVLKAGFGF